MFRDKLRRETATVNALIPYVIRQGSEKYRTIAELNGAMENNYGGVFDVDTIKKGEEHILQFYLEFVDGRGLLPTSLEFLAEVMYNPLIENGGFKPEYVELAKTSGRITMDSRINNKAEYAKLRCIESLCEGEPFSVYGDGYPEDLEDLSPADIYNRFEYMSGGLPMEIFVIGNQNEDELSGIVKGVFRKGDFSEPVGLEKHSEPKRRDNRKIIRERMEVTQGKACVGLRSGIGPVDERFYSLMVANEILGGGPASKLFINARERESLCYYINAQLFRSKGIVMIQSGTSEENFDKLLDVIETQISQLSEGRISDGEMAGAKKSLVKKYSSLADYPAGIVDFHFSQHMLGDGDDVAEVIKKIEAVGREDICEASRRLYVDTVYLLGANL